MEIHPDKNWGYDAKCADPKSYQDVAVGNIHYEAGKVNTELFFPPRDRALYRTIANAAKDMCYGRDGLEECPVRRQCLLDALRRDEMHGIFGGKSHRERAAMLRRKEHTHPEMSLEEYVNSPYGK